MLSIDNDNWLYLLETFNLKDSDVVATWNSYIDESGTHEYSPIAAVATAQAPVELWNKVIPEWQNVLKKYNVDHFHATEVNGRHGEYNSFSKEKRDYLVKDLFDLISGVGIEYAGFALEPDIFEEEIAKYPDSDLTAYDYLLLYTLVEIDGNTHGRNRTDIRKGKINDWERTTVIIEAGCNASSGIIDTLSRLTAIDKFYFIKKITFEDKKCIPLQVADLFVYELFRESKNNLIDINTGKRHPLKRLDKENSLFGGYMTREWIKGDLPDTLLTVKEWKDEIEELKRAKRAKF